MLANSQNSSLSLYEFMQNEQFMELVQTLFRFATNLNGLRRVATRNPNKTRK